jgi:hypothetical protein
VSRFPLDESGRGGSIAVYGMVTSFLVDVGRVLTGQDQYGAEIVTGVVGANRQKE